MVVLRLTRTGKKKQAFYRIVVADSRRFVNSKFIEIVGWYNPKTKEVSIKEDRVAEWMSKGAQPSNTVAKLFKTNGVKLPDWVVITEKNRKPKKEPVIKEPKVEAPAPAEPVAEEVVEVEEVVTEAPSEETTEPEAPADDAVTEEAPAEEVATETTETE